MRKMLLALLLAAMFAPAALAVSRDEAAQIARDAAGGAEVARVERDGGVYEVELRAGDARYRVEVFNDGGAVLAVETVYPDTGRGAGFDLTEEEARAAAAKAVPEAARGIVTRERGGNGSVYEVFYAEDGAVGAVEINAQTGAIAGEKVYPEAAARGVLSAGRIAELVEGRRSGARIVELELEWEDGRYRYEGEAEADGARYSFEFDAQSGAALEFERDD